jgi:hypothetical protein
MAKTTLTRRTVLNAAALATPFMHSARAAATIVPKDKIVLAWHN